MYFNFLMTLDVKTNDDSRRKAFYQALEDRHIYKVALVTTAWTGRVDTYSETKAIDVAKENVESAASVAGVEIEYIVQAGDDVPAVVPYYIYNKMNNPNAIARTLLGGW